MLPTTQESERISFFCSSNGSKSGLSEQQRMQFSSSDFLRRLTIEAQKSHFLISEIWSKGINFLNLHQIQDNLYLTPTNKGDDLVIGNYSIHCKFT